LTAFGGSDGGDAEVKYVGVVKVGEGKLFLCWNEEVPRLRTARNRPRSSSRTG
jgi:hypothetical protein